MPRITISTCNHASPLLSQRSPLIKTSPPLATLSRLRHHFHPLINVLQHAISRVRDRMFRPIELTSIVHDQLQVVYTRLDGSVLVISELCFHRAEIHGLLDNVWVGGEIQSLMVDRPEEVSSVFFLFCVADLCAEESVLRLRDGVGAPSCFARWFNWFCGSRVLCDVGRVLSFSPIGVGCGLSGLLLGISGF